MRLFIAIKVNEEILKQLKELQAKTYDENIKASKVKDFHLTLKFLGEVEESKVDEIAEKLSKIKHNRFELVFDKLGVFPDEDYVRVIWVGGEDKEASELQRKIDDSLKEMFPKDNRFSAHLTLMRVKFVKDKKMLMEKIKSVKVEKMNIRVESFFLILSTLTPEGPRYEDLKEFKLY